MSTIAKVLRADSGQADVHTVDWDRVFSYELKIYNTASPPVKVAEIVGDMKNVTLASLEFERLRKGGCGPFSFTLAEEYSHVDIDYNYRVEICFYTQTDPWFTGYITKVPQKGTDPKREYGGVGYFQQLEYIRVNEIDEVGQEVEGIVEAIYDDYLDSDTNIEWNAAKIDSPGYTTVATQRWERITARACFETLAELAQRFEFGVDADREFYFRNISSLVLEKFWIGKHLTEFKPVEDQSDLCNRLYIRCGLLTDGTDYTIMLENAASQVAYGLREDVVRAPEFWPIFSEDDLCLVGGVGATAVPAVGVPARLINNDPTSLWEGGAQDEDDYIQIDLGVIYDHLAMVILDSDDPAAQEYYARGFKIEISTDGAWAGEEVEVFTTDENSTYRPIITFTPTQGRYVRITLTVDHANDWDVGEVRIYELTTADIERWGNYILDERKDIKKKAMATIVGVDKLINLRSTLGPIEPRGLVGVYDEDGDHIDDYANVACRYSLTPASFNLSMELGAQKKDLPSEIRRMLQQMREFDMSGVRNAGDLAAGVGAQPGIITRTMISKDVIEVPHLKGEKISLYGGLIEMGKGVLVAGGHGFIVNQAAGNPRVEIGRLNGNYGIRFWDATGEVTVELGELQDIWKVIHDEYLVANTDQWIFDTGLDGDNDNMYCIVFHGINNFAGVTEFHMRINNDAGANYGWQTVYCTGAGAAGATWQNENEWIIGVANAAGNLCQMLMFLQARQGHARIGNAQIARDVTGTTVRVSDAVGYVWDVDDENIDRIDFIANRANGIRAGSRVTISKIPIY